MHIFDLIVIGAGPAGFYAAITAKENNPSLDILIVEKGNKVLSKILVSGGGRCNLTHACYDPKELIEYYPRGAKELLGPFTRFQPADIINWFEDRGVKTKTEADGRIFPITDKSSTIANCLIDQAKQYNIKINKNYQINTAENDGNNFLLQTSDNQTFYTKKLLLAAGGNSKKAYEISRKFGHSIIPLVPSLFTFNIKDPRIANLMGVSVPNVEIIFNYFAKNKKQKSISTQGPLLITHWGISGPAVLKLSAWAARHLFEANYRTDLMINWIPGYSQEYIYELLQKAKTENASQRAIIQSVFEEIPSRLWKSLLVYCGILEKETWQAISNARLREIAKELTQGEYQIHGKGVYKDEFVTCGGIDLREINFKTMESKLQKGLFFAGEILDIDGLTGGFNFQAAWTTGWIAGKSIK